MHKRIAIAVGLALSPFAHAADGQFDWLAFSGYGTIAASETDDKDVGFHYPFQKNAKGNDWATDVDSRLAVQLDFNRGGQFSGVLQVLAMQRNTGEYKAEVEWANVMWTINDSWRVRAGRMVTPVFMQSDYRFVGYSLTPVRYSLEMAGNYPLSRHDGAEVVYGTEVGAGHLQVQGFGGKSSLAIPSAEYKADSVFGAAATYSVGPWTLRASGTAIKIKIVGEAADTALASAALLENPLVSAGCPACTAEAPRFRNTVEGTSGQFYGLGAAYDEGNWYAQAEYGYRQAEDGLLPKTSGWLLLGAYRWGAFTPYLSYSGFKTHSLNDFTATGTGFGALAAAALKAKYYGNASDREIFGMGVRWDFYRNVALKLQAEMVKHDHKDAPFSGAFVNLSPTTYDGRTNVYSAALDFVF
ncbi:hypothetical protein GCM10025771_11280 [Niveibacterium umoris]|uniref:Porin domain-containing protein n=1 Tax=Niveibacterium umoris TaxID=1193620 RepID=A0A840BK37_9RHOO|nr:porin [Niveibacterium umoris]MBB4013320.1 hypothetical protein [Niveibacterium umoris]